MSDASAFSADQAQESSELQPEGTPDPLAMLRAQLEEIDEQDPAAGQDPEVLAELAGIRAELAELRAVVLEQFEGAAGRLDAALTSQPAPTPALEELATRLAELETALRSPEGIEGHLLELTQVTEGLARTTADIRDDLRGSAPDAPATELAEAAAAATAGAHEDLSSRLEELLGDEPEAPRPATAGLHERLDALALELRASLEALLARSEASGQLDALGLELSAVRSELVALREVASADEGDVLPQLVAQVTTMGAGLHERLDALVPHVDVRTTELAEHTRALGEAIRELRAEAGSIGESASMRSDANAEALRADLANVSATLAQMRVQLVERAGEPLVALESLRGELARVLTQVTALAQGLLSAADTHAEELSATLSSLLSGGGDAVLRRGDLAAVVSQFTALGGALAGAGEAQHAEVQAMLSQLLAVTEELRERSGDVEDTPLDQLRAQVIELSHQARERGTELEGRVASVLDSRLGELHAGITLVRERAADHATREEFAETATALHTALSELRNALGSRAEHIASALESLSATSHTLVSAEDFDARADAIADAQRELAQVTSAGLGAVRDRLLTISSAEDTAALIEAAVDRLAPREVLETVLRTETTLERAADQGADLLRDLAGARGEIDDLQRQLDSVRAEARENHDVLLETIAQMQAGFSEQLAAMGAETTRLVALATGQAASGATEQVAVRIIDEVRQLEARATEQLAESEDRTREALAGLEERVISEAAGLLEQVVRAGAADLDDARRKLAEQLETVRTALGDDLVAVRSELQDVVTTTGDNLADLSQATADALGRTEAEVTAAFAEDLSASLDAVLAELAAARGTVSRTGQDLTAAARTLLAYLAERDAVLEADRALLLVDILDDLALSLSRAERRALTDRLSKALDRRREAADAERYRQLVDSGAITPPPSSSEPGRVRAELVEAAQRSGAMELPQQRSGPAAVALTELVDTVPDRSEEDAPTPASASTPAPAASDSTPERSSRPAPRAPVSTPLSAAARNVPGRTVSAKAPAPAKAPAKAAAPPAKAPVKTPPPAKAPTKAAKTAAPPAKAPARTAAKAQAPAKAAPAPAKAAKTAAPPAKAPAKAAKKAPARAPRTSATPPA